MTLCYYLLAGNIKLPNIRDKIQLKEKFGFERYLDIYCEYNFQKKPTIEKYVRVFQIVISLIKLAIRTK